MARMANRAPQPTAWDAAALGDPHAQHDKAARVQAMFDAIAPAYERFNTVATFGRDAAWRRAAVAAADVRRGDTVLDLCCGTGDMLRAFAQHTQAALLIGVDFAANMLVHAHFRKGDRLALPRQAAPGTTRVPLMSAESGCRTRENTMPRCREGAPARSQSPLSPDCQAAHPHKPARTFHLIRADALRLPLADASVDVISCTFGVRNFQDLGLGLSEMFRVARPGARVVILEFATPEHCILRWVYRLYCDAVLPCVGALLSRDRTGAYRYLPRSIDTFAPASALSASLKAAGFRAVTRRTLNFGGVVLHRGTKPETGGT
jgi:demethylmenaquinone methyltransferase/2-methoxy-6-polyprenyl-1,4-benzoquinol methylase